MLRTRTGLAAAVAAVSVIAVAPAAASPFVADAGKKPCFGKAPTIFSTRSNVTVKGTGKADVIESTGKNVTIVGGGGNDRICGLDVKKVTTGTGNAKVQVRSGTVATGKGTNTVVQKGSTTKKITFTGGKGMTAFTVPASELRYATVVPGVLGDTLNGEPITLGLPTGGPSATLLVEANGETSAAPGTVAKVTTAIGLQSAYPASDHSFIPNYDSGTGTNVSPSNAIAFYTYGVAAPAGSAIAGWSLDLGDGSPLRTGHGMPPAELSLPVHGPGTHVARLTVVDTLGRTATSTATLSQAGEGAVSINAVVPGAPGATTLNIAYSPGVGAAAASYALDYGDGTAPLTGNGAPPAVVMHTYPYGDYEPHVYVFDDHGDLRSASQWVTYTLPATYQLTATPLTTPEEPGNIVRVGTAAATGLAVNDTLTLQLYDPYSAYVSVDWGDGTVQPHVYAHEATVGHHYDRTGAFTAKVTAVDTPTVASVSIPITVVPTPVLVSLSAPTSVPQGPLSIGIHTSRLPAGATWQLSFTDGSAPISGAGPLPSHFTHTFAAVPPSTYGFYGDVQRVYLYVEDAAGGGVGSAFLQVVVTGPQPAVGSVGFGQGIAPSYQGWAALVAGETGYVAAGLKASAGHVLKKATVSFGDGSAPITVTDVGSGFLPSSDTGHTYAAPGDYTVTVTATDSAGLHASSTSIVSVAGRPTATLPANESAPTHAFALTGIVATAGTNDAIVGYTVAWGDNTYTSGVGAPPSSIGHTYPGSGAVTYHPVVHVITSHFLYAHATTNASLS